MSHDQWLDDQAEAHNTECDHYKNEIDQEEYCKYCKKPCEDYLELLDNDELIDKLIEFVDWPDYGETAIKAVRNEIEKRMKR